MSQIWVAIIMVIINVKSKKMLIAPRPSLFMAQKGWITMEHVLTQLWIMVWCGVQNIILTKMMKIPKFWDISVDTAII